MRKIFAISAIVCFAITSAFAQQPDAEYQLLRQRYTVNADGSTDYNFRKEIKLIRNRAITAYADKGETFIVYDPKYEVLTINESYTIRPDGSRVQTPENAFIEQLPSQCADCGRFNGIREMAIVHTALEYNCVIVLDYTIHRNADLVNETIQLVEDCPVRLYEVEITVPEKYELIANLKRTDYVDAKFVENKTSHSYRLVATNLPQSFNAPYLPSAATLYPTLTFYNGTPQFKPEFDEEGLSEAMLTIVNLMDDNPFHTVRAIRNHVVDNIHLNDIPASLLGYTHATASETWQSGCGTATDRAVLLAAMLRTAGFKARVYGKDFTQVAVTIDTMEYDATPNGKIRHLPVIGEAHDVVNTIDVKTTIDPTFDTFEGGYYRYSIPTEPGAYHIDVARLTPSRTAPLLTQLCNENYSYTVKLPKGMKMISPACQIDKKFDGIGTLHIKVKQSGRKLNIERSLVLEKEIVTAQDYDKFRQMMTAWAGNCQFLFKMK